MRNGPVLWVMSGNLSTTIHSFNVVVSTRTPSLPPGQLQLPQPGHRVLSTSSPCPEGLSMSDLGSVFLTPSPSHLLFHQNLCSVSCGKNSGSPSFYLSLPPPPSQAFSCLQALLTGWSPSQPTPRQPFLILCPVTL